MALECGAWTTAWQPPAVMSMSGWHIRRPPSRAADIAQCPRPSASGLDDDVPNSSSDSQPPWRLIASWKSKKRARASLGEGADRTRRRLDILRLISRTRLHRDPAYFISRLTAIEPDVAGRVIAHPSASLSRRRKSAPAGLCSGRPSCADTSCHSVLGEIRCTTCIRWARFDLVTPLVPDFLRRRAWPGYAVLDQRFAPSRVGTHVKVTVTVSTRRMAWLPIRSGLRRPLIPPDRRPRRLVDHLGVAQGGGGWGDMCRHHHRRRTTSVFRDRMNGGGPARPSGDQHRQQPAKSCGREKF